MSNNKQQQPLTQSTVTTIANAGINAGIKLAKQGVIEQQQAENKKNSILASVTHTIAMQLKYHIAKVYGKESVKQILQNVSLTWESAEPKRYKYSSEVQDLMKKLEALKKQEKEAKLAMK